MTAAAVTEHRIGKNRRPMRLAQTAAVCFVVLCSLVPQGCAGPQHSGGVHAGSGFRAALVLDTGGVDDRSFNAGAWAGLQRAMRKLGVQGKYVESRTPADYKPNLTELADAGYDLVFAVGYKMQDDMRDVATDFPKVRFAIVDGDSPPLPNCTALQFREEQGAFLAGFLAASISRTKTVGFVGGEDIPLIKRFEAGYRAGAKTADPTVQVLAAYTGDWNDLNKGKSQAQQEFANGADIIFQAAGKAGLGVIEAAREQGRGYYAIGVDQDQDAVAPGRVLTSMVKHVDNAVFDTVRRAVAGTFQSGPHVYDLKEGGVGLTDMKYTRRDIPAQTLARLQRVTEMVADGAIVPPTTLDGAARFQPPRL